MSHSSYFQLLSRRVRAGNGSFHSLTQKSGIVRPERIPLTKIVATIGPASEQLVRMRWFDIIY